MERPTNLTPCELAAALQVWQMAITAKCNDPSIPEDFDELAQHYGKHLTTPENLEAVSHCFNWDKILPIIGVE